MSWRQLAWSAAGALLLLPLVAMQFSSEVHWTALDFVFAAVMLATAGGALELASRVSGHAAYRAGAAVAVLAAFVLIWVNAAVGIIGNENNPANLMYPAVVLVAVVGAGIARLRPRGMALALLATAVAQALAAVVALLAGWGPTFVITGVFLALWLLSAALFRLAARASGRR